MAANPLKQLYSEGVSLWLDYLSRTLVDSGRLKKFIDDDGLRGETSNPTIFQKAVSEGTSYAPAILELAKKGLDGEAICWELMMSDIQHACDVFKNFYNETRHSDGFVSLELNPTLAHDTAASLKQAHELTKKVDRPNVMYKVPGTDEGLPVIEALIYEGYNVNVTLLFDIVAHGKVIEAYMKGLERRAAEHKPLGNISSVASFFVSRVDSECDTRMDKIVAAKPELKAKCDSIRGQVAVANARLAYELFEQRFSGPRWEKLRAQGAAMQRPLWASTGTKNKAYSDTLYVAELIGPHIVNTMPEETMNAFRDHGVVKRTLTPENAKAAHQVMATLKEVGVDFADVTKFLVDDGVKKFEQSYKDLVGAVAAEREKALAKA